MNDRVNPIEVPQPDKFGTPLSKWWQGNLSFEALDDMEEFDRIMEQHQLDREAELTDEEMEEALANLYACGHEIMIDNDLKACPQCGETLAEMYQTRMEDRADDEAKRLFSE